MASEPSDSSQSGRSCPRRSAIAIAQRRLRVDARRAGEQRAVVGVVAAPRDLAGRVLVVEREVDRALDRRPAARSRKRGVAGGEVVVPHAVGDVAGDVGVERGVLDLVAEVVRVPRAVGALHAGAATRTRARASSCRPPTSSAIAASTRFHGSVWPPGVHGMLPSGSWIAAIASTVCAQLAGGDDAGDVGQARGRASEAAPSPCRRRGSCRAPGSAPGRARASHAGCCVDLPHEEVVVACAPATRRCCRAVRALQPPVRRVQRVRVVRAAQAAARPPRASARARAGGRCGRGRRACRGSGS